MTMRTCALELFTPEDAEAFDGVNPAAWNLGIAATALGDRDTAHAHPAARSERTLLGLAGREPELTEVVEAWAAARPAVAVDLALLW